MDKPSPVKPTAEAAHAKHEMLQELLKKAQERIATLERELALAKLSTDRHSHWDSESHVERNMVLQTR